MKNASFGSKLLLLVLYLQLKLHGVPSLPNLQLKRINLVVKEWKACDEFVHAVESGGDQVLRVVAKELQSGKHSKSAILEFLGLAPGEDVGGESGLAGLVVSEEAVVVDGTNEEENLHPAKGWDGAEGSKTMWDIREGKARGDLSGESVELRDNVTADSKHGNTSVLELGRTVLVESRLVNVVGQSQGVKVTGGKDHCCH